MSWLKKRCEKALGEHWDAWGDAQGNAAWEAQVEAVEAVAREFAERVLASIFDVDENDRDDERARGSYRLKLDTRPNVERRHYRKEFHEMVSDIIADADKDDQ